MTDNIIEKLSSLFIRFPGIGPRQARRFVYFLLKQDDLSLQRLGDTIKELKKNTAQCPNCFRFFVNYSGKKEATCEICLDPDRYKKQVMIVEKDVDLETVRKADDYDGYFFVLGGLVPILEKNPAEKIRIKQLIDHLKKNKPEELILALSVNPDGDHTIEYLKNILAPILEEFGTKITILGRGLSTGTELEYSDADTIANALKNRK